MRLEYSDIAQTVHDYLLWSRDYDAEEWEEFSKGKCRAVPLTEAIGVYRVEVDSWLNAN